MNQERFDELARGLATNRFSRGQVLKGLAASLLLSGPLGALWQVSASAASCASKCQKIKNRKKRKKCLRGCEGSTCPAERVCGASCCAEGERCVNGACVTDGVCGADQLTGESMDAAVAKLDAGENDVALSAGGCFRYRRTITNGRETRQEITANGKVALRWDYTDTLATGERDADLDGFSEWRLSVDVSAGVDKVVEIVNEYSPSTQALLRRGTFSREGDVVHVLWEEADSSGTLRTVSKYDTSIYTSALPEGNGGPDSQHLAVTTTGCTPGQETLLKQRLKEAFWGGTDSSGNKFKGGVDCLTDGKLFWTMFDLVHLYVDLRDNMDFVCTSLPPAPNGQRVYANTQWLRVFSYFIGNIEIKFDTSFFSASEQIQRKVMLHEMLHLRFGEHQYKSVEHLSTRREETDQIYACAEMCFGPNPNKCHCASCLKTNVCDKRCNPYQVCTDPDKLGAICPCKEGPNAFKWFPKCSDCLSSCPSGLKCFGIGYCIPLDVSCRTSPASCP